MKVYRMIPKQIDFLEKPLMIKIEEHEGEELKTFAMDLQYYKEGRNYIVIDPKLGFPVFRTTQKAKIRKIAETKMPSYQKMIGENFEKIVRIHNTYFEALNNYQWKKEEREKIDFNPLRELAKKGSQFEKGKERIIEVFKTNKTEKEKTEFLKKEYGTGGFGLPRKNEDQYELCSGWWDSSNILLEWYVPYQEEKEVGKYTYTQLKNEIKNLIENNKYM